MAGTPQTTPQPTAAPELSPGLPFNQPTPYKAPEAGWAEILTSLGGLGLNIAGAATGTGAAGNQALSTAKQLREQADQRAAREYQASKEQTDQTGDRDISKSLFTRILELPKNEQGPATTMLQSGQWEKVQQLLNQNEVRQRQGKDDFSRLKAEAEGQIRETLSQTSNVGDVNAAIGSFFMDKKKMASLEDQSPDNKKRLAQQFLLEWNQRNSKESGKRITFRDALGAVDQAAEYYNERAPGWPRSIFVDPKPGMFNQFATDKMVEVGGEVEQAGKNRSKVQELRTLLTKAATKESPKAIQELKEALLRQRAGAEAAPPPDGDFITVVKPGQAPQQIPKKNLKQAEARGWKAQ